MGGEEVEETFGLDLPGDQPLLPSLFIFLFLLDFLDGEVARDPLDMSALRKNRSSLLQDESFLEFGILDNLVGGEGEVNGEVVAAFLVSHMDVFKVFEQLVVFFSQSLLDHGGI